MEKATGFGIAQVAEDLDQGSFLEGEASPIEVGRRE